MHHFDADLDPTCYFDADPDPACHFDADPDPDPTFHFVADPFWIRIALKGEDSDPHHNLISATLQRPGLANSSSLACPAVTNEPAVLLSHTRPRP